MTPPDKRPPPLPGKPILDQQPERAAVRMPRAEPPKRTQTLPGIPSLAMPPLPGEFAPTLPVPNPLQRLTVRRPTPPSTEALARRTPVPPSDDPPVSVGAATGQPGASLPPPSATPDEATRLAHRRVIDSKDVELDRERRERQKLELQLEIERERNKKSTPPPKPWIDERLVKALVGLLTAMTALGAPLGIWLTAKATAAETAQQRQGKAAQDATTTASSAKAESSTVSKEIDELRQRERAKRAYDREVFRRMGVIIPKVEGDPDPPQLDVEVPLRKPGTVTPGPVLVVKTPPP